MKYNSFKQTADIYLQVQLELKKKFNKKYVML